MAKESGRIFALTTIDNRFDPILEYDEWKFEDEIVLGYHTEELLGCFSETSPDLSDEDYSRLVEETMDLIVSIMPFYRKIVKEES